jgi:hypothetical protein
MTGQRLSLSAPKPELNPYFPRDLEGFLEKVEYFNTKERNRESYGSPLSSPPNFFVFFGSTGV